MLVEKKLIGFPLRQYSQAIMFFSTLEMGLTQN